MNKLKVLCPFCNAVQDAGFEHSFDAGIDCESCGPSDECTIEISCKKCKKVIYRK